MHCTLCLRETGRIFLQVTAYRDTASVVESVCAGRGVTGLSEYTEQNGSQEKWTLPDALALPLSSEEQQVLALMRRIGYGEVRVVIKDSAIVLIEEKKTFKP